MAYPQGVVVTDTPTLDEPVLIVMLQGWIDAAGAGAAAASSRSSSSPASPPPR